jgi:cyclomaltodextrinase / maltogenic alpha-amylase / neopullulanase
VSEPDWVRHAVWWQIYPLGFTGAYPAAGPDEPHRLGRLHAWLDYAIELGASGLALGPVFASETHGYDTVDHFRIDPRLGDEDDFAALITAAHDRGLRVLLDGVFNHVGRGHPAFQAVLRDGDRAPTAGWFARQGDDHATFEGHPGLVALNHAEPAVADLTVDVMRHWLDRGADGWRLDAAYAVPAEFWAGVLARVRERHPEAYVVGEVIHGDYAEFVASSTVDSVTQYELWKAIWSALNSANFFELSWALERHNGFLDGFAPLTFVGNHDVTRIASRLTDERDLPLAVAILLTVGGTPSLYAGDEQAFRGVKADRAGGDDAVRPRFPDKPADLVPYGRPTYRLYQELIGLRRRHPWLHRARTSTVRLTNEHFAYDVSDGAHRLRVTLDVAAHTYRIAES